MNLDILLDSHPLGLLSNPAGTVECRAIAQWSQEILRAGHRIYVPEVIDYELRRELLRANKARSIVKLDRLKGQFIYVSITTAAMVRAADLWAHSRSAGIPTGDPKKLDIDVIVCAQALSLQVPQAGVIVATINVRHISRFVTADHWNNITP